MVKDRSDKIKDYSLVKEKNMNVSNMNNFSDYKSYQMKKYDSSSKTTKKIEQDTSETENYYKGNTGIVETTNKQIALDTQNFDQSGYKLVERKVDRKNRKERLTKYDSKDFTHNERLQSSRQTVQKHSQKSITSDEKPTSRMSSKTVDSNKNKKNSKISNQNRYYESNANSSIRQNHTNCGEKYVETLNVTTNKLNFKDYEKSAKQDNQPKKLNIKTSLKHSLEKSARNDNLKCNGEMSTTYPYTESLNQAKDASYLTTRMKEQNIQINTNADEIKTVSVSEQLTLENEMVSNHSKTLIDECINQTHYQAQYVEEIPLNTNLDIQIKEATSRVKEQLTINGTANRVDEVKDYTETYAIPGHDGSTQRANDAGANNFEHASEYVWYDNGYLPYLPVIAYPLNPYGPVFAPVVPYFNRNTSLYNQHLYNGRLTNEYSHNEFLNIPSWDQLTYQPIYFEQSAEYLTNWPSSNDLIYHSENLNGGYRDIEHNGMVYYQY